MYRVTYSTVLSYIIRLTHHRYYQLLMEVIIKLISSEIETCIIDISSVCLNIKEKKGIQSRPLVVWLNHSIKGDMVPSRVNRAIPMARTECQSFVLCGRVTVASAGNNIRG